MRMLITGAAGFIGSNFAYFQAKEHPEDELILLDKLTYAGCYATIQPLVEQGVRFFRVDICNEEIIEHLFTEYSFDCVINFAAESHVDRSIKNPSVFLRTNVEGTRVLMDACLKHGTPRFHQVSTDEVYGDLPLDDTLSFFTEETPLLPSSPYSASKASADLLIGAYARTYGLPASISRCSNNHGPYQFPEKLIPRMISCALNNKPLPVYGKGANVRDWLYVEDHCRAIDLIVRKGMVGSLYNVGGQNEMSNIDMVHLILEYLDKPASLITFVEDRKGHDLRYAIDFTKIKNDLGWEPEIMIANGITRTIDWYLSNHAWWEGFFDGSYLVINDSIPEFGCLP